MSTPGGVLSHLLRPRFGVGNTLIQLVLLGREGMEILVLGKPSLTCPLCGAGDRINQKGLLKPNQGAAQLLSPESRLA